VESPVTRGWIKIHHEDTAAGLSTSWRGIPNHTGSNTSVPLLLESRLILVYDMQQLTNKVPLER